MLANTKRILIETESHEIFSIRLDDNSIVLGFCESCAAETLLLTLDKAVTAARIGTLDLIDCVRKNNVHYLETATGHLLICRKSLEKHCIEGVRK